MYSDWWNVTPISSNLATCHLVNFSTYITLWEELVTQTTKVQENKKAHLMSNGISYILSLHYKVKKCKDKQFNRKLDILFKAIV